MAQDHGSASARPLRRALLGLALVMGMTGPALAQEDGDDQADTPDPIDKVYATGMIAVDKDRYRGFAHTGTYRSFLPPNADLSRKFPAPGDQGGLGACTAWAVGYAARSYYSVAAENGRRNDASEIASPAYIYHAIRREESCVEGTRIADALDLLKQEGAVSLRQAPYSDSACNRPSAKLKALAHDFRITGWKAVSLGTPDNIKGEIAKGNPVVFGMSITQEFHQLRGIGVYAAQAIDRERNHAMVVVGYDDAKQAFKVINSWGRGWGAHGFGWISYDAFNRDVFEAYVMDVAMPLRPKPEPKPAPEPAPVVNPPKPAPKPAPEPVVNPPKPAPEPEPVVDPPKPDCSKLSLDPDKRTLTGFVASAADLAKITAAYQGRKLSIAVDIRPWPQCEMLLTLDKQLTAPHLPMVRLLTGDGRLKAGETLAFEVKAPDRPAFVYASYVQADGSVVTLSQPELVPPEPQSPHQAQTFGDGKEGRARFAVSPPFGKEMVVVLASRSPLFDEPLPKVQTEREYLTLVRKAIIYKPDPKLPDRDVSAVFVPLETEEK
jgi:hypothetical protein